MKLSSWLFDEAYRHRMYIEWSLGWAGIVERAAAFFLLLLAVLGKEHWVTVALCVVAGVLVLDFVGWFAVSKKGWLAKQNSIANQHNPELLTAARQKKKHL